MSKILEKDKIFSTYFPTTIQSLQKLLNCYANNRNVLFERYYQIFKDKIKLDFSYSVQSNKLVFYDIVLTIVQEATQNILIQLRYLEDTGIVLCNNNVFSFRFNDFQKEFAEFLIYKKLEGVF